MTVSYDQMLVIHDGKRYKFVPYPADGPEFGPLGSCNGNTCAHYGDDGCLLIDCGQESFCISTRRRDGCTGSWEEVKP